MSTSPRYSLIAGLALIIGFNLRPIMASIGPLLDILQQDLGLSSTQASLLTTLPVFLMGVCALAGPWLQRWVGEVRGIALGMLLITLASAARLLIDSAAWLIVSAAVAGTGIAMVQALMPAWLKRNHPERAGSLMGLFTTGIMGGAVIAAAGAAPAAEIGGWRLVLGVALIPALLALIAWMRYAGGRQRTADRVVLPYRNARAWFLLAFFGIGTSAYTLVLAWLPAYYIDLGRSPVHAGYLLGALSAMEVVSGLAVSSLVHRFPDRRPLLTFVILLMLAGLGCLILAPISLMLPAIVLLGLGIGALFPLSLIVTLDHADSPAQAGALLAFVQGGGYAIAALMPLLAGVIRDTMASLQWAWVCMVFGALVVLVMTWRLGRTDDEMGAEAAASL
ncbi:MFS transporter, CP family, cyanate transporter [Halopseudomonas litoralis]|uniref:MFS transporter, CP family, cyanate transporter n=1 Tax=Halopseudomonas litoralis TaxID=797277 RepID=A0A1H1V7D8_9GAMM|nr:MFS transporter [Halopseudomonas litoralis]SDS80530.1 MFS transporter, CP family, cyanate transporter [Halopseudomonas litoralis]